MGASWLTALRPRKALAGKLLLEAQKSSNAPSDEFILLGGAVQAAQEASDLPLAFQAADAMAKEFLVDATGLKAQSLLKMPAREFVRNREENQRVGLALLDELEAADDYAQAERIGTVLQQNSGGADRSVIQQRVKLIHDKQVAMNRMTTALAVLNKKPDDPAANFDAGRYLCLVQGDWTHGLPMLAKGSDATLKGLAAKELAATKASTELGDAWWEAADHEAVVLWKKPMQQRAVFWYRQALEDPNEAKGLVRAKMEKRVESLQVAAADPAAEAKAVLAEVVEHSPMLAQSTAGAKLLHVVNGTELRGGTRDKLAGSFSEIASVVDGRGVLEIISGNAACPAGRYFFVFRIQPDHPAADANGLDPVCTLEVRHGTGLPMASSMPRGFVAGKWTSISLGLVFQKDEMIQFRVRSWANHAIALDRIYVFKMAQ